MNFSALCSNEKAFGDIKPANKEEVDVPWGGAHAEDSLKGRCATGCLALPGRRLVKVEA